MPPILVNIGDLLAHWTNGLLKSTIHRVVFPRNAGGPGEDRYSIAYFCHPVDTTPLVPVPSEMVRARSRSTETAEVEEGIMTAGEHLQSRLAATYGWSAEQGG